MNRTNSFPGRLVGILLLIVCTLLNSTSQVFLKTASNLEGHYSFLGLVSNPWLVGGLAFYAMSTLILMRALKMGDLSILYPVLSLTYVWVCLSSPIIFRTDTYSLEKTIGVLTIVVGVLFLSSETK